MSNGSNNNGNSGGIGCLGLFVNKVIEVQNVIYSRILCIKLIGCSDVCRVIGDFQ